MDAAVLAEGQDRVQKSELAPVKERDRFVTRRSGQGKNQGKLQGFLAWTDPEMMQFETKIIIHPCELAEETWMTAKVQDVGRQQKVSEKSTAAHLSWKAAASWIV
jgi:hypothetical protein